MKVSALLLLVLLLAGCSRRKASEEFGRLSNEFTHADLALTPISATGAGLHSYENQDLDDLLDDVSPGGLQKKVNFYQGFQTRLAQFKEGDLEPQDRADLQIIKNRIAGELFELQQAHSHQNNPTLYVEMLGDALFTPLVLEYRPKGERIRDIIMRLRAVPQFLEQAELNLTAAPAIWTQVAIEEQQANIDLVDKTIRAQVPAELSDRYRYTADKTLVAMEKFQTFLKTRLAVQTGADWRLGPEKYRRKFAIAMETGVDPDTMLRNATADLQKTRAQMFDLATPLHRQFAPAHGDHAELAEDVRKDRVIREVLDKIGERHSTRASYMADARADLDEARQFVRQKGLLTLPERSNLQVIETPEYMRGAYSVGGFNPAPALQPELGAFYWVTPIPATWSNERAESKLREYNFYKLKLLTIHEAMPGHYVQAESVGANHPQERRVLRSLYGNGAYVEGWAMYAEQLVLDAGFLNNAPEMQLTFLKERLRVILNAILDIRLQAHGMSDEEALALMQTQGFQEREEAVEKLQRAKLTSCQLPTYYAGWSGWLAVREQYKKAAGQAYNVRQFNDRALQVGAVPLSVLGGLLQ